MGVALFFIYTAAMFLLSLGVGKSKAQDSKFIVNDRSSSSWVVGFSIVASCIGASATIGMIGLAFQIGTPAFWWLGSSAIGLSILGLFLAKKVRRSNARTLPEITEIFFGKKTNYVISVIIVVAWLSILAAQLTAATMVVKALTGWSDNLAFMLGAFLILFHTLLGGQASVLKLDRIQCLIIIIGLCVTALWLMEHNLVALRHVKLEIINPQFSLAQLSYYTVILGGSYIVCPMLFGRLLSAKEEKTAQRGALGAVLGILFTAIIIVLIGLLARGLIPETTASDQVLTAILQGVFPSWLSLTIYLVLLSGIISSADSCLFTASLILAQDICKKSSVKATRISMVFLIGGGMLLTLVDKNILGYLLMANNIYVCSVVAPVFMALLCYEKYRFNHAVALFSILLSSLLGLYSSLSDQIYLSYIAILVSVVFIYITKQPVTSDDNKIKSAA